jgi:two-component sensor histidine kinase
MVVIENASGQILHANDAVGDVLGVDCHGIAGTTADRLWTHINGENAISVQNAFADLQVGRVASLAVTVVHPVAGELHVRLRMFIAKDGLESFVLAEDMTQSLALEKKRLADAVKQKDGLVREVHHRIKNNLQGVAGLLQQSAIREPKLTAILGEVAGQIHAVAQVHGLQLQDQKLTPQGIVRAIADNIRHTFGHSVPLKIVERDDRKNGSHWIVPEQEAVPLALVINEITSNALKHGEPKSEVTIHVTPSDSGFEVVVSNKGQLPDDFDLATRPVSPSGLGLIRALMPKRGAELTLESATEGLVVARLVLEAPALMLNLPITETSLQLPDRHV